MPTPVSVARQCLTPDAAQALDEAVAVARRRSHAQTTSLHAVSALLSLPSSTLRDACARARNAAYSPRLQFKALELCLSVSLDRVPSGQQPVDDPPVSNSLMAAIKRSQANQRRQPENFHLYRDIISQQNPSNISCVKVELKHLILSILDDPVVSRVFGEAGFRSSEIKLAIIRPLPNLLRFSRPRAPPGFLGYLEKSDPGLDQGRVPGRPSFSFPFPGFADILDADENCRRIGEVLTRRRNPLLVGVSAYDTLNAFIESVEKRKHGVLAKEISGLSVACVADDVSKCIHEGFDKGDLDSKFEEMRQVLERNSGPGLVVNYGDLKVFLGDNSKNNDNGDGNGNGGSSDSVISYVVSQLTMTLRLQGEKKVWLIGAAASYETYLKFVGRFPSTEKDWDLQILPITSLRPSSVAESYPRSSLMESFVPFGGFFSLPSESSLSSSYQHVPRCHLCNEKCEQEVLAISKGGFGGSVADQYQSSLPSWLQMTEITTNDGLDVKAKDDGMVLSAKLTGLQKKWDSICQRIHHNHALSASNTCQVNSQFPTVVGFQFIRDKIENADSHSRNNTNALPNENTCKNVNIFMPANFQKESASQSDNPSPVVLKAKNGGLLSKLQENPTKAEDLEMGGPISPCSLSSSSVGNGSRASPTSVTSVTTDLGLGFCSALSSDDLKQPTDQNNVKVRQNYTGHIPAGVDLSGSISNYPVLSSSSCLDFVGQFETKNFKTLCKALTERVDWQDEAASVISKTVANRQVRNEKLQGASQRGDIWFNFIGPDRCGKTKIAVALAELICGGRENFICVDLSVEDGMIHTYTLFDCHDLNYDLRFRGKNVVDFVAGELSKKPLSVVFLENVDKADVLVQTSLYQAIRTGKFSDSHGREVSTNNAIFVTTSTSVKESKVSSPRIETSNYSEDKILRAKGWPIRILIEPMEDTNSKNLTVAFTTRKGISNLGFLNKRKLVGANEIIEQHEIMEMSKRANRTSTRNLDLNIPAEENEAQETDSGSIDNDSSVSENSNPWLQDFFGDTDTSVVNVAFKPFDFDALADKLLNDIGESFHKFMGSECLLEIDQQVMEQLLAAAYLSESSRAVREWVEQVLSRGFAEVRKRYNLIAHSVVKILTCDFEEGTPGVHLLPEIILT